jgi:hypothetical protein
MNNIDTIVREAAKKGHGLGSDQLEPIIREAIALAITYVQPTSEVPKSELPKAPAPEPVLPPPVAPKPPVPLIPVKAMPKSVKAKHRR